MTVLSFVTAAMLSLSPGRDHSELATAIASIVEGQAPLFRDDADKLRTAAFAVAVAWRESGFKLDAIGDHGRARCAFQLWAAPKDVLTDAKLCTSIAFDRMRESFRACGPTNVLGIYAAGVDGCQSEKAKRISRDRMWVAKSIAAKVLQ